MKHLFILICLLASLNSYGHYGNIDSIGVENNNGNQIILYKITHKDTYYSIARLYSVYPRDIMIYNDNTPLEIGIVIKVPTKRMLDAVNYPSLPTETKDFCNDVLKNGSELTGRSFYRSHAVWFDKTSNVVISKIKSEDKSNNTMAIYFTNFANELSFDLKGLYIKFSDGALLKYPDKKIEVEYNGTNRWEYRVLLIITPDLADKLKSNNIEMANFGYSGDVKLNTEDINRLHQYFLCMSSL